MLLYYFKIKILLVECFIVISLFNKSRADLLTLHNTIVLLAFIMQNFLLLQYEGSSISIHNSDSDNSELSKFYAKISCKSRTKGILIGNKFSV